jgi:hypothetical protein
MTPYCPSCGASYSGGECDHCGVTHRPVERLPLPPLGTEPTSPIQTGYAMDLYGNGIISQAQVREMIHLSSGAVCSVPTNRTSSTGPR